MSTDNSDMTLATQENSPSSQDFDIQRIAAHEDFATKVAAAALKKKELQIQPVLAAIEINNSKARADYIRGKTNLFKKDVIMKGILFLESLFPPKSPSSESSLKDMRIDEIKDKLAKFITATSPNYCNNCDSIFEKLNGSKVTCYICTSNLCQKCSSEDSFNKAKAAMKNIVSICSTCQEENEEVIVEVKDIEDPFEDENNKKEVNTNDAPKPETISPIEVEVVVLQDVNTIVTLEKEAEPSNDANAPFQLVKPKKAKNTKMDNLINKDKSDKSDQSDKSNQSDKSDQPVKSDKSDAQIKLCTCYVQYRCKYGPMGKDCPFDHPKICRPFMKSNTEGCNKGDKCQYLHPKMCPKSTKGQNCN